MPYTCYVLLYFCLINSRSRFYWLFSNILQFDSGRTANNKNINQNTITESHFESKTKKKYMSTRIAIPHYSDRNITHIQQRRTKVKITSQLHIHTYGASFCQRQGILRYSHSHTTRIHTLPVLNCFCCCCYSVYSVHTARSLACLLSMCGNRSMSK